MTEKEIREWFAEMASGDYSEEECRAVLVEASKVLPVQWLIDNWNHLYHEQAVLEEIPSTTTPEEALS